MRVPGVFAAMAACALVAGPVAADERAAVSNKGCCSGAYVDNSGTASAPSSGVPGQGWAKSGQKSAVVND